MDHNYKIMLLTLLLISCASSKQMTDQSYIPLLSQSMEGWSSTVSEVWSYHDGVLTGAGERSYISTDSQYDNFILEAEFKPDDVINSGIFVRCPSHEGSAVDCYEINISDDHANQDFRTGSIVTHGKPLAKVNSVGYWNTYKIKAEGNHIEVWLNGTKTADLLDDKSEKGYIVLQVFDKGEIQFRNVRVKELQVLNKQYK